MAQLDYVVLRGGNRSSKIKLAPDVLGQMEGVTVVEGLALDPLLLVAEPAAVYPPSRLTISQWLRRMNRARHPEPTAFYQLFDKHFDDYVYACEDRFEDKSGPLRPVVRPTVEAFFGLGTALWRFRPYPLSFMSKRAFGCIFMSDKKFLSKVARPSAPFCSRKNFRKKSSKNSPLPHPRPDKAWLRRRDS